MEASMRIGQSLIPLAIAAALFWPPATAQASNPCCKMISIGVPNANITLDGTASVGEWAGAGPATIVGAGPLDGTITELHKADGLYFLFVINDSTNNQADTINMRFDIDHSGG